MSVGEWTHAICDDCWTRREPDREPVRLTEPLEETCCYCGCPTTSGIYVRDDPKVVHGGKADHTTS